MIPVCVSRCEDCTKVQCVVRPGCGEQHELFLGVGKPDTGYSVYITNLTTGITRVFPIETDVSAFVVFDLKANAAFLTGNKYRIIAIEYGDDEPAEFTFIEDNTKYTCAEVEFKNLYDAQGNLDAPVTQWLAPY